ncbi:hypothetical protein M9Y10_001697 [Tritrichomonas musculus]|uniref:Uncharacterized protein n=1 Tax=Tritrichomonas musculus TaxID=1915356 RepID=A0ABR2L833_9EUKA
MENVKFPKDMQGISSNYNQKNKKNFHKNTSLKTIGIQSENPLNNRPPFRSGRVKEEEQKFLSIPDKDSNFSSPNDSSINNSINSSSSKKMKNKKLSASSSSQHSYTSKNKSKIKNNRKNQNFNTTNSVFEASKLLKQPNQSKRYNLDFDSRWEYFLELKTLDDATKRIYNSAFFQLWKTIYQKRYMQRAEEQASQINSTLDRFHSTHSYDNSLPNSNNPRYRSNQNQNYYTESRNYRSRDLLNGYSYNSIQGSSEARVEKIQQKYRKRFDNYTDNYNFELKNNLSNNNNNVNYVLNNYRDNNNYENMSYKQSNNNYNQNLPRSYHNNINDDTKIGQVTYTNRSTYNIDHNISDNDNNLNNTNYNRGNYHINFNRNSFTNDKAATNNFNQDQATNQLHKLSNDEKNNFINLQSEDSINLDYLKQQSIPIRAYASESTKQLNTPQMEKIKSHKEAIISPSKSYNPSISKDLIEEIEGKISDQNEKELAKDFATQLDAIAYFNNTLTNYNNHHIDISYEEEDYENKSADYHNNHNTNRIKVINNIDNKNNKGISIGNLNNNNNIIDENSHPQVANINDGDKTTYIKTNNTNNNYFEEEEEEEAEADINSLNDSTGFIGTAQKILKNNKIDDDVQSLEVAERKINFSNSLHNQRSIHNSISSKIAINDSDNQDPHSDTEILAKFDSPYQQILDKYDQYIEKLTNSVKINNNSIQNEDEDDDDFMNSTKLKSRSSFPSYNTSFEQIRTSNSTNQVRPKSKMNFEKITLEQLLKEEAKNSVIPVDTDLNNKGSKQISASRIQSVLSKSSINFNRGSDDDDSDRIDLSDVQFYHVRQARNAIISNFQNTPNISESIQSRSAQIANYNRSQSVKFKGSDFEENYNEDLIDDDSSLKPVSRMRNSQEIQLNSSQRTRQNLSSSEFSMNSRNDGNSMNANNSKNAKNTRSDRSLMEINSERGSMDASNNKNSMNIRNDKDSINANNSKSSLNFSNEENSMSMNNNRNSMNTGSNKNSMNISNDRSSMNMNSNKNSMNMNNDRNSMNMNNDRNLINMRNDRSSINMNSDRNSMNMSSDRNSMNTGSNKNSMNISNDRSSMNMNSNKNSMNMSNDRSSLNMNNDRNLINMSSDRNSMNINSNKNSMKTRNKRSSIDSDSDRNDQNSSLNMRNENKSANMNMSHRETQTRGSFREEQNSSSSNSGQNSSQKSASFSSVRKRSATMFNISPVFSIESPKLIENEESAIITGQSNHNKIAASSSSSNSTSTRNRTNNRQNVYELGSDEELENKNNRVKQKFEEFGEEDASDVDKRRFLASLYDDVKYKEMEKNSHVYKELILPFPDDLYDDVFTNGSDRRNEYLESTKLASIINFFTNKEMEGNEDENET